MKKKHNKLIYITIIASVLVICFSANRIDLHAGQKPDETQSSDLRKKGSGLYEKYCSMCHGPNGEGYLADEAPALANQDFLVSASDAYIISGILRGRPGTPMSAWAKEKGGALTKDDAAALLSYIRSWQKEPSVNLNNKKVNGNAENGSGIYERWCAACHGKYGADGNAVKLSNPVFQETASDGFIRYAVQYGRRDTPMAAYKKLLKPAEIDDVVAFVRTLKIKDAQPDTVAVASEDMAKIIREKGVIHPGNPSANFQLIENRYAAADAVYAAYKAGQSLIIVDARPQSDYLRGHIKGAISIPFYDIGSAVGLLPKDIWIITYCVCPHALSGRAADQLKTAGYDKVAILDEGFFFWQNKGYPTEIRPSD
ncbi:MAG: hypothetical protein C4518_05270 [Desulfobacteraceae bacterium]|nr:MAG: hypothetical protein C4518_05270 [Desulfobacteraceae bacterium]